MEFTCSPNPFFFSCSSSSTFPLLVGLKPVPACLCPLQETAARKRDLLRAEFLEIKALIEEKENQTLKVFMEEEKRVCNKFDYVYKILGNKKNEIQSLRDQIEMALTEGDDVLFLKVMCPLDASLILQVFRMQNHKKTPW